MIILVDKYNDLSSDGKLIQSFTQHKLATFAPEDSNVLDSGKIKIVKPWQDSIIDVVYNDSSKAQYLILEDNEFCPEYRVDSLNDIPLSDIRFLALSQGFLSEIDLKIIYGKLPQPIADLRHSIFSFVVNDIKAQNSGYRIKFLRAYLYCVRLLELHGLVSFYRYVAGPTPARSEDILNVSIPEILDMHQIINQDMAIEPLLTSSLNYCSSNSWNLNWLNSIHETLGSNEHLSNLLKSVCLLILAQSIKPEEYKKSWQTT